MSMVADVEEEWAEWAEQLLLFPETVGSRLSPKAAWMRRHGIVTGETWLAALAPDEQAAWLAAKVEDDCGFPLDLWAAWREGLDEDGEPITFGLAVYGRTEDEALAALAKGRRIRLWFEEGYQNGWEVAQ